MYSKAVGNMDPPGYTAPVSAAKNYIRRVIQDADISCPFKFSWMDFGSCVKTFDDGSHMLVIGVKDLYEHAETRKVLLQNNTIDGLPEMYKKDDRIKYENVGMFRVPFARDDDVAWLVKTCFHELEHLVQKEELFTDPIFDRESDTVRMCVDDMLHRAIPEYYMGSYHVMADEIDAERHGIQDGLGDLSEHYGDLGLNYGQCEAWMLDRIEREPHWYGEKLGPDTDLDGNAISVRPADTWPNRLRCRSFSGVSDACQFLLDYDTIAGEVNGLSVGKPGSVPSELYRLINKNDTLGLSILQKHDDVRMFLMNRMVKYNMLEYFDDAHIAGFSMWPVEARAAYNERIKARENALRIACVASVNDMKAGVCRSFEELPEHKKGEPLVDF